MTRCTWLHSVGWLLLGSWFLIASAQGEVAPAKRTFLIGNSLTWDTVPARLDGDVQFHVDCGVNLPHIQAHPDRPCVKESTLWPQALSAKAYEVVVVQPHYGSTLSRDVETISAWMKLQPDAVFVIHTGWAFHAQRAAEFESYAVPDAMTHGPVYFRALLAELRRLHPDRELRQTFAQHLLAQIADDIEAGRAPLAKLVDLYRDDIHLTRDHGRYLMHQAMRRVIGQPSSAAGFEPLDPGLKSYLDGVLSLLDTSDADRQRIRQIISPAPSIDRPALIAQLSQPALRDRLTSLLPAVDQALQQRPATLKLRADVESVGGRLVLVPSAPTWLYLLTGDEGTELFDLPATVDLYNGNNPLKGKGGRNEQVTDAWLERLSGAKTLRKLDLANCSIAGEGLRHIAGLNALRELNLTLTPVNDDGLKHLGSLTELRSLGLASTQCTGTGFAHLTALQKLENVNFHFTPLNDAGLEAISRVPISGRLWFAHTQFTDAGVACLARLTQLKRCGLGSKSKESSGAAVESLASLPLEELSLLDAQASPAGLAAAAKIATLRKLDASYAPTVTDNSLAGIAQLPMLEEFKLGSAQVTDAGLEVLAASKSLKKLSLSGLKRVTPEGIAKLRAARPEWTIEAP